MAVLYQRDMVGRVIEIHGPVVSRYIVMGEDQEEGENFSSQTPQLQEAY